MKGSFKKYGSKVTYDITDEQKDAICERLIEYYSEYGFFGECIQQNDDATIEASVVLSDICDEIIIFKEEEDEC